MSNVENRFVTEKQVVDGYELCKGVLPELLETIDACPPLAFYNGNFYRYSGWHGVMETPSLVVALIRNKGLIPGVNAHYWPNIAERIYSNDVPTIDTDFFGMWTEVTEIPHVLQKRLEQTNG